MRHGGLLQSWKLVCLCMNPNKQQKIQKILLAASITLMLFSLGEFAWLNFRLSGRNQDGAASSSLPALTQLPQFTLIERSGRPMGLEDLRGKIWIADFIFTRCPGPCPLMTSRMARLQSSLEGKSDVLLVSFSVYPENDTPEVLTKYADQYHADRQHWFFLTGEKSAIHQLAQNGFLVGGVDDVMMHTTRFILVDRQARVRGYYDSNEEESLQKLMKDIETLLRERST